MQNEFVLADTEVLNQLANDTSEELMPTMLQVFCTELQKRQGLLTTALGSHDYLQITEQAHAIKSSSGTFGAARLQQHARILERAAKVAVPQATEVAELGAQLLPVLVQTVNEYQRVLSLY